MMLEQSFQVPPNCGKRLLPAVLDEVAASDPTRTFVSVPKSSNISEGFDDIDYGTFAKAVDKFATWLRSLLDPKSGCRTILYIGPVDLRYLLVILGCAKAGHIAFFSSHRNSVEAHKAIAEGAGCQTVLVPEDAPAVLDQLLQVKSMTEIAIFPVEYYFEDLDRIEHIAFTLTWEEAKDKPFCVLHTSGSTGIPKPVFVTYGTFACNDAHQLIPTLGGKPTLVNFLKGKRFFVALPLFHAACLTFTIGYNIFAGVTTVIPPTGPLTASVVNEVFKYGQLDGALLPPSLIVDCYNNDEYCVNMVQQIPFLSYVGGSLPEEVGDALSTRIKLMTLMGSCETALHPLEINEDPADWQYLTISKYLGHSFREERDGYQELFIKRDPKYELFQGVFSTFPQKQEFGSGDLFEQHPFKPESWVFRARTDDIIAFTTAEKLNPITMESVISTNPKIKSALIGGQGKFQAALLIEPHLYPSSESEEEQYIKDIWPSVVRANRDCPAHGRIMKGFVMLTNPAKPIPRAGKGTVQRHAALKLYAGEFEALYAKMLPQAVTETKTQPSTSNHSNSAVSVGHDDLDARIEAALARVLPGYLEAAIQKVLTQALLGLGNASSHVQPVAEQTSTHTNGIIESPTVPYTNGTKQLPVRTNINEALTNGTHTKETSNGTQTSIRKLIYDELSENLDLATLTDDADLFKHGLDSLQIASLVTVLNSYLIKSKPGVKLLDAKEVYANPTVGGIVTMMDG